MTTRLPASGSVTSTALFGLLLLCGLPSLARGADLECEAGRRPMAVTGQDGNTLESCSYPGAEGPIMDGAYRLVRPDGSVAEAGTYKTGRRHGQSWAFFPDGTPKWMTTFAEGLREGPAEGWHGNGDKRFATTYVNDKEEGLRTEWHPGGAILLEGAVQAGERVGLWVWYDTDGARARSESYAAPVVQAPVVAEVEPVSLAPFEATPRESSSSVNEIWAATGGKKKKRGKKSKRVRETMSKSFRLGMAAVPAFAGSAVLLATTPLMYDEQVGSSRGYGVSLVVLPTPGTIGLGALGVVFALASWDQAARAYGMTGRRNPSQGGIGFGTGLAIVGLSLHGGVTAVMAEFTGVTPGVVGVNMAAMGLYLAGVLIIEADSKSLRDRTRDRLRRSEAPRRARPTFAGAWITPKKGGVSAGFSLILP